MKTIGQSAVAIAVITGLYAGQLSAQESKADESDIERLSVVGQLSHYSATKTDTPIMQTSRSVSIESLQELLDKGAFKVDDAYTYSAGVTGKTFGFATRGDWVRVRGLDVPQYQDSLQSLFGNYNNTRADIYTLEQVEILKGPASVLYGKGSPGGLVNVVSKRPQSESRHELVAEGGNYNRKQLAFDSTGAIDSDDTWLYRAVGVYRDTDTQIDHVGEKAKVLAPSLTWNVSDQTSLTVLLNYSKTESDTAAQFLPLQGTLKPAPNGQYIDFDTYVGDPNFGQYDAETKAITLFAEHEFNDIWRMELTARRTSANADYKQAWTSFLGAGVRYLPATGGKLYKDGLLPRTFYRNDASSDQTAADVRFKGNFIFGEWEHSVLIGGQYQDVSTEAKGFSAWALGLNPATGQPAAPFFDTFWINPFNPVYGNAPTVEMQALLMKDPRTARNSKGDFKDTGIYVSDQITYGDWLINLGVRYDELDGEELQGGKVVQQDDDAVSSSVGIMYQFESGLSPYINYAESFDPVIGGNGNGQPLKPREGKQTEVGVKYEASNFPAFVTLAYFDISQTNLNDPANLPGTYNQQRGKAKIYGVELEAKATLGEVTAEVNLSHLNHESASGKRLASVPENQGSIWMTYRPTDSFEGLRMGAGIRYVGSSWGGVDRVETPSYTLADLMLGYQYQNWDFSLNIRNASDKKFLATCLSRGDCFPGGRRTVVGRIRYAF